MLPYDWLADNTRWQRKPRTFDSIERGARGDRAVLSQGAVDRRRRLRRDLAGEGRALRRRLSRSPRMYDVPLMVARGYAILSFLHSAAEYINDLDVPAYIYHLGDFDPSGVNAGEKIEETLRELAPDAEIIFERIAVTPEQIEDWNLPTRPTKATDSRAKGFGDISVELDAIEPDVLRGARAGRDRAAPARRAVRGAEGRRGERARTAARDDRSTRCRGVCAMTARERLPNRRRARPSSSMSPVFATHAAVGRYRDGRIAEIFLTESQEQLGADTAARDAAIVCSFAVQHGADPERSGKRAVPGQSR